eukprot:TRINITY_DN6583_c0_g1_i9.p1 TRINITY_DN6583_c0_g1~~TRINITY_DN6583_c0_g1_i9.p1  ORF type:complete len:153 (-),score=32.45 TRINITY_DN6583_c0_g1_i9:66-524(-)
MIILCFFFFFKQKTAYEMLRSLVGSEMCIRDRWGAISFWGRSNLHFFSSTVNAAEYKKAIKEAMLDYLHDAEWMAVPEGIELTFMQDGAPCHTAASTDQWLEENLPSGWRYTGRGQGDRACCLDRGEALRGHRRRVVENSTISDSGIVFSAS